MPSLRSFRRMAGLPDSIRRWSDAAEQVKAGQKALAEQARGMQVDPHTADAVHTYGMPRNTAAPMDFTVDWLAVSHNEPSRNMPRSVPWVHGLIRDAKGPSPRIELSPKRQKNNDAPVQLVLAHPDQAAAEAMGWDDSLDITVDGHTVSVQKSMGPAYGWCEPEPIALVVELDADHPLVVHAAEAAKGPKAAMDQAQDDLYAAAREWCDANFPHPDFMNVVRRLVYDEWNGRADYWPGDPLPAVETICAKARDQIRG